MKNLIFMLCSMVALMPLSAHAERVGSGGGDLAVASLQGMPKGADAMTTLLEAFEQGVVLKHGIEKMNGLMFGRRAAGDLERGGLSLSLYSEQPDGPLFPTFYYFNVDLIRRYQNTKRFVVSYNYLEGFTGTSQIGRHIEIRKFGKYEIVMVGADSSGNCIEGIVPVNGVCWIGYTFE